MPGPTHLSAIARALPPLFATLLVLGVLPHISMAANRDSDADALTLSTLSLDELLEIEVTTTGKVPETIRDTPASAYLVTRSDIEREGHMSVTEIFNHVPGLYNIDNYEGASGNFGIRGFWNS